MLQLDVGETEHVVAETPSVAPLIVAKWSLRWRATGSAAPGKIVGHLPRKIRAAGVRLFCLPACSPDLNPTEHAIAKPKRLPCKAAERTGEAVWRRFGSPRSYAIASSETQDAVPSDVVPHQDLNSGRDGQAMVMLAD